MYTIDGVAHPEQTTFYTPNEWVWNMIQQFPGYFLMAASIHPYRDDAVNEIKKWAAKGVRLIKLLPNSMNI